MHSYKSNTSIRLRAAALLLLPILFLVGGFWLMNQLPVRSTLFPPQAELTAESLETARSEGIPYINLTAAQLYRTGCTYTSQSGEPSLVYYAVIDDTCIYVLLKDSGDMPEVYTDLQITGSLFYDAALSEEIALKLAEEISIRSLDLKKMSLPLFLYENGYRPNGIRIFCGIYLLGALISIPTILQSSYYLLRPSRYRRRLKKAAKRPAKRSF